MGSHGWSDHRLDVSDFFSENWRVDTQTQAGLESRIRGLHQAGDLQAAATCALEGYGPEIFGCMVGLLSSDQDAEEAFAEFAEDVWVGLPGFGWRSSFRTWAYVLARNAVRRLRGSGPAGLRRAERLSRSPDVERLEVLVRSVTRPYLRTEVKSELTLLRESLDTEDQLLLILRLDKGLSWREIAVVFAGDPAAAEGGGEQAAGDQLDDASVERRAAALRKRFQVLKDELRARAAERGLLGDPGKSS
jgi:RNA polymerase sigma-70 factor (ECF subfamily)